MFYVPIYTHNMYPLHATCIRSFRFFVIEKIRHAILNLSLCPILHSRAHNLILAIVLNIYKITKLPEIRIRIRILLSRGKSYGIAHGKLRSGKLSIYCFTIKAIWELNNSCILKLLFHIWRNRQCKL